MSFLSFLLLLSLALCKPLPNSIVLSEASFGFASGMSHNNHLKGFLINQNFHLHVLNWATTIHVVLSLWNACHAGLLLCPGLVYARSVCYGAHIYAGGRELSFHRTTGWLEAGHCKCIIAWAALQMFEIGLHVTLSLAQCQKHCSLKVFLIESYCQDLFSPVWGILWLCFNFVCFCVGGGRR